MNLNINPSSDISWKLKMTNVFLVPGGKEEGHLRSIKDGVSLDLFKDILKNEERERLERIYTDG